MKKYWEDDLYRYTGEKSYSSHIKQYWKNYEYRLVCLYRKSSSSSHVFSRLRYRHLQKKYLIDISPSTKIGKGFYLGHASSITINSHAILGDNINIHKGATIGQTNRGDKKGTPHIGNNVWIGINSTIVGGITVGDNVLIAPNAYVNFDVPSNSIVIGNPGIIKESMSATEGYVNRRI